MRYAEWKPEVKCRSFKMLLKRNLCKREVDTAEMDTAEMHPAESKREVSA